jgi:hypothetical protein
MNDDSNRGNLMVGRVYLIELQSVLEGSLTPRRPSCAVVPPTERVSDTPWNG